MKRICFLISDIVHRDLKLENILVKKLPDATNPEDKLQIKVRPNKKKTNLCLGLPDPT